MVKRSISEPLAASSSLPSPECCVLENVNDHNNIPLPEEEDVSEAVLPDEETESSAAPTTARELALFLVFKEIAHAARAITTASGTAVVLLQNGAPVYSATCGVTALQVSACLTRCSADSWKAGKPQLCHDAEESGYDAAALRKLGVRSFVVIPVRGKDNVATAIIEAFSAQSHGLSHRDLVALQSLGLRVMDHIELAEQTFASKPDILSTAQDEIKTTHDAISPRASWFSLGSGLPTGKSWNLVLGTLTIFSALLLGWVLGRGERNRSQRSEQPYASSAVSAVNQIQAAQNNPEVATDDMVRDVTSNVSKVVRQEDAQPDGTIHITSSKHSASKSTNTVGPSEDLVIFEKGKQIFPMDYGSSRSKDGKGNKSGSTDSEPTVTVSEEVANEHLLERVEPDYPDSAREQRLQGTVVLDVRVGKGGTVRSLSRVTGDPQLSILAAQAVRQWKFTPLLRNGAPVNFETNISLNFALP